MKEILENLYYYYGVTDSKLCCPEEEQRIKTRRGNFKKLLKRNQYRQIQRLLDDTDNITCKMSILNFASGVKFGIKLMTNIYASQCDEFLF